MGPDDPTRAGPPAPPDDAPPVMLSLPEIESLCQRAARGAGRDWGLAEEAGWAASWLAARGLPGPDLLRDWLTAPAGDAPAPHPGAWAAAAGGPLCPLATGVALADFALLPEGDPTPSLRLAPVPLPVLLLPFLARMAAQRGSALDLDAAGCTVGVTPEGGLAGDLDGLLARPAPASLRLSPALHPVRPGARRARLAVDTATWRQLDALALATTVPPSDRSRAGAGAGGSDSD